MAEQARRNGEMAVRVRQGAPHISEPSRARLSGDSAKRIESARGVRTTGGTYDPDSDADAEGARGDR